MNPVWLAVDRLGTGLTSVMRDACVRAGLEAVAWRPGEAPSSPSPPLLLVAGLPRGQRRIPDDLVHLVNETAGGLPLVLVTEEPLVQPSVTIQEGRAVLFGPPLTAADLSSRLSALAKRGPALPAPDSQVSGWTSDLRGDSLVVSREFLRTHWWVAGLSCRGAEASVEPQMPQLRQGFGEGLTLVLPASAQLESAELDAVARELSAETTVADKEAALARTVGERAAVVHVSPGAGELLVWRPAASFVTWLVSPLRLPTRWDIGAALDTRRTRLFRLPAAGGDLLVTLGLQGGEQPRSWLEAELTAAFSEGGPALLDRIENRLKSEPVQLTATLVEIR